MGRLQGYIDYETYDELVDKANTLPSLNWIPTDEEIDRMEDAGIEPCLFLITMVLEHAEPVTVSEKKRISRLNKTVLSNMEFGEEKKDTQDPIIMEAASFHEIEEVILSRKFVCPDPFYKEGHAFFTGEYFRYCIAYMIYGVHCEYALAHREIIDEMQKALDERIKLTGEERVVFLTKKEYRDMRQRDHRMDAIREYEQDPYYPTEQEIMERLLPNLRQCYDFVIWLLEDGKEPKTPEEVSSRQLLEYIRKRYIYIS